MAQVLWQAPGAQALTHKELVVHVEVFKVEAKKKKYFYLYYIFSIFNFRL